ncbi:MAG: 50S ribosomal protein L17 [bacterium]|nr:50S ribosomal protein L17 [bacterium]
MRHRKSGKKLGRTISHRKALFRNLIRALVISEKIVTTESKAKAVQPIIEKLISVARNKSLSNRRRIAAWIPDNEVAKKLVETIATRYQNRPGGYTRIIKLGRRVGDTARMARLEFVESESSLASETKETANT